MFGRVIWVSGALALIVGPVAACSDQVPPSAGSPTAVETSPLATPVQTFAAFCDLATRATEGEVAFGDPVQAAELTEAPDLTSSQRLKMRSAIEDARAQLATGAGYSNDLLVAAVNEICGLKLTPVTMVE